jgi:hypothetical protein
LDLHKRKPEILKQSFQQSPSSDNDDVGAPAGDFNPKPTFLVGDNDHASHNEKPTEQQNPSADHNDEHEDSHKDEAAHDESADHMSEGGDSHSHNASHGLRPGSLSDMHWFWFLIGALAVGSVLIFVFPWGSWTSIRDYDGERGVCDELMLVDDADCPS